MCKESGRRLQCLRISGGAACARPFKFSHYIDFDLSILASIRNHERNKVKSVLLASCYFIVTEGGKTRSSRWRGNAMLRSTWDVCSQQIEGQRKEFTLHLKVNIWALPLFELHRSVCKRIHRIHIVAQAGFAVLTILEAVWGFHWKHLNLWPVSSYSWLSPSLSNPATGTVNGDS